MQGLSEVFLRTGCTFVQTYIQSGNVVFQASHRVARDLLALVTQTKQLGMTTALVVRDVAELEGAARANPFALASADLSLLHVVSRCATDSRAKLTTSTRSARLPISSGRTAGRFT